MVSTRVSLVLRQYERPDKTKSVNLRITHNRKIAYVSLNVSIPETDWDKTTEQIDEKCKIYRDINRVNDYLIRKKLKARRLITELYDEGRADYLTVQQIKAMLINKSENVTFKLFTEKIIKELKAANRLGNATAYQTALNFVLKNNNHKDFYF